MSDCFASGVVFARPETIVVPSLSVAADKNKWRCVTRVAKFDADIDEYRNRLGKRAGEAKFFRDHSPVEVDERIGNLVTIGGVSVLWEAAIGNAPTYFSAANAYIGVGDSSTAEVSTQTDLQASTNKLRVAMDSSYPLHSTGTTAATISGATNAIPIVITTGSAHGYSTGDFVYISGVAGNTAANGLWSITVLTSTTFSLTGSTGSGTYTSGGIVTKFNVVQFRSTFGTTQANYAWNEWGVFNASSSGTMLNRKTGTYGTKTSAQSWQFLVGLAIA